MPHAWAAWEAPVYLAGQQHAQQGGCSSRAEGGPGAGRGRRSGLERRGFLRPEFAGTWALLSGPQTQPADEGEAWPSREMRTFRVSFAPPQPELSLLPLLEMK